MILFHFGGINGGMEERNNTREAEAVGAAILRVLLRIEAHLPPAMNLPTIGPRISETANQPMRIVAMVMVQPLGQFAPMASSHMVRIAPMIGSLCRSDIYAASADQKPSGSETPRFAAIRATP